MNALERTRAVLRREAPDQIPFVPYEHLVPRGELSRELRNRGMGMCTQGTPMCWSEWPHVRVRTVTRGPLTISTWETQAGRVSSWTRTHLQRQTASQTVYTNATVERNVLREGMIKDIEDIGPAVCLLDDEIVHQDYVNYEYAVRDLREDCLVRVEGLFEPYCDSFNFFGPRTRNGMANWARMQRDHPREFAQLLAALERRQQRRLEVLCDAPGEIMYLEGLGSWFGPWFGAKEFQRYTLPFFQKYLPALRKPGRLLALRAETPHLRAFRDMIPELGIDIIEGFIPPPLGDLSLAEARRAWGDRIAIWLSFPESLFWEGAQATRAYTLDLLRDDPGGPLVIGMTVTGTSAIADQQMRQVFGAGMHAIMDAIEQASRERSGEGTGIQ